MFKYDVHVHTSEVSPCGKVSAKETVRLYKQAGYTGIVITDHYFKRFFEKFESEKWQDQIEQYLTGYRIACDEGRKLGLDILLGIELRFTEGRYDYLVYGINENFLVQNAELYNLDLIKLRELVKGKGILIYQAHPFRDDVIVPQPYMIDGIEIYNGNQKQEEPNQNDVAYKYALDNNFRMISGSDFHMVQDLAMGGIILENKISDSRELARVMGGEKINELIIKGKPYKYCITR